MGAWSGASDGYDPNFDTLLVASGHDGYAGIYHHNSPGWSGPTGLYSYDIHGSLDPNEGTTWWPIHIWATPDYIGENMALALEPDTKNPPPADRLYTLRLLYVPPDVTGAPPVGTLWTIPLTGETTYTLPTYWTLDPLSSYRFAFTISTATDPCQGFLVGDSNCDGAVDFDDINPFVAALAGEEAWRQAVGGAPTCVYLCANDIDGDGDVNFSDINAFVALLGG
jgi:hypothetical protein